MIDKKIYSGWAFTENSTEKSAMNKEIYKELRTKYSVKRLFKEEECAREEVINSNDFVFELIRTYYARTRYRVLKCPKELTTTEKALIIDDGNLPFGYLSKEEYIDILID
jgi:hypothetical protein